MKLLCQAIEEQARRLGFDLFGVTTPDPPPHFEVYLRWIEAGKHGEMDYLAEERAIQRRADPRQILPECRSILVLGARYPAAREWERPNGPAEQLPRGRVAAYAWGDDYHEVFASRLRALVEFIDEQVGARMPQLWYSDTGPILERDLAQRAGLGWIGKNTCLINPKIGSYFLLAEVLLGLELEPDPPFQADRCGSCTRCLEACPTGCILPDRTIEARRCLSYLTIEVKGGIPEELRSQFGDWVFGCDICQQVCPWNGRFAASEGDPAFAPRPGLPNPDLIEELGLTPEGFNQKFKKSPLKRAKRGGYLRNVATSLGSRGVRQASAALGEALSDPEALVRAHAAWALGQIGEEKALAYLEQGSATEEDPTVMLEIRSALQRLIGRSEA